MAYELSKKVVIDTQEFNDYAVGLSIPLKNGNGGFFEQNYTTFDQARSNLKNLLLTKKGERIAQPNFGSGLQDLLFEQIDPITTVKITDSIRRAINLYESRAVILDLLVYPDEANSRYGVKLTFRLKNDPRPITTSFKLERLR